MVVPFKSKAQQRWMFSQKPEMAKRWADHTPDIKSLPEHVDKDEKSASTHTEVSMSKLATLAAAAAEAPYLNKLASDSGLDVRQIRQLAAVCEMPPVSFCKNAYVDPQGFNELVKLAGPAGYLGNLVMKHPKTSMLGGIGIGGAAALGAKSGRSPAAPAPAPVPEPTVAGEAVDQAPMPRVAGGAGGAGGGGGMHPAIKALIAAGVLGGGYLGAKKLFGKKKEEGKVAVAEDIAPMPHSPSPTGTIPKGLMDPPPSPAASGMQSGNLAGRMGPAPLDQAPMPKSVGGGGPLGGMAGVAAGAAQDKLKGSSNNPRLAALMGSGLGTAGMIGAGGLGLYALHRLLARKKRKTVEGSDNQALRAIRRAVVTKIASHRVKFARACMDQYLNEVVCRMPSLVKSASVRRLQAEIVSGKPLSKAIKVAYPHLHGEARGVLAMELCKAATNYVSKLANENCGPGMETHGSSSMTGPIGDAPNMFNKMGKDKKALDLANNLGRGGSPLDGLEGGNVPRHMIPAALLAGGAAAGAGHGLMPGLLAGAGYGHAKGRTGMGMARGAGRGVMTGGGLGLGAMGGAMLGGALGGQGGQIAGALGGGALGGIGGWKLSDKVMGKDMAPAEGEGDEKPKKKAAKKPKEAADEQSNTGAKVGAGVGAVGGGIIAASRGTPAAARVSNVGMRPGIGPRGLSSSFGKGGGGGGKAGFIRNIALSALGLGAAGGLGGGFFDKQMARTAPVVKALG